MLSLKESIISSNNAGHPAYRFSLYGENNYVSILVEASSRDAIPEWNKKKVKELFDKLDNIYKQDVKYIFNSYSNSENKVFVHIWCILSSCKNEDEVRKTIESLFGDKEKYDVVKVEAVLKDRYHPYLRIVLESSHETCALTYNIRTTTLTSRYRLLC